MSNRRSRFMLVVSSLALASFLPALGQDGDAILGLWLTTDIQSCVEIYRVGDTYHGRIVGLKSPAVEPGEDGIVGQPRLDIHNPDTDLRDRPLVGLEIMTGFRYDKGTWSGGRIYDPENGKSYKCKLTLDQGGQLKVRGYVGISAIGRTEVWAPARRHLAGVESYLDALRRIIPD